MWRQSLPLCTVEAAGGVSPSVELTLELRLTVRGHTVLPVCTKLRNFSRGSVSHALLGRSQLIPRSDECPTCASTQIDLSKAAFDVREICTL